MFVLLNGRHPLFFLRKQFSEKFQEKFWERRRYDGRGEMKFAQIREYSLARDSLMQIAEDR